MELWKAIKCMELTKETKREMFWKMLLSRRLDEQAWNLIREHADQPMYTRALAAQLHRLGRTKEAVEHLDALGEHLLQSNRKADAVEVITQIIAMNPRNAAEYRTLLAQIAA